MHKLPLFAVIIAFVNILFISPNIASNSATSDEKKYLSQLDSPIFYMAQTNSSSKKKSSKTKKSTKKKDTKKSTKKKTTKKKKTSDTKKAKSDTKKTKSDTKKTKSGSKKKTSKTTSAKDKTKEEKQEKSKKKISKTKTKKNEKSTKTQSKPFTNSACGKKRYCKEMSNCEEARFYLKSCGLTKLDRDKDGTPCESLCIKK